MRRRKWILVFAVIVCIVIFGGYFGWRVTKANEKLKEMLLAEVRPFLAQESDIEKLEMDLSGFHLRSVRLTPKDRSFSLKVDDVRLGYGIWSLLKYGFAPQKMTHEMILVRPELIIRSVLPDEENGSDGESWVDFREVMEALRRVKRITVAEAEVVLENTSGERVRLAQSVNGWFQTSPVDSAVIRLGGRLFEAETNNLMLNGKLDLLSGRLVRMKVQIKESEPSPDLPLLLPGYIQLTSGKMKGEANFDPKVGSSGFIEIQDGAFSFKEADLYFEDVNVMGNLEGEDIVVEGTVKRFNGSPLEISGRIQRIFDPHLDIVIHCSRFDIPAFFRRAVPGAQVSVSGKSRFGFHFTGMLNNPKMSGDVVASGLHVYGMYFSHFRSFVGLRDSVLTLKGKGIQKEGMRLSLNGKLDFSGLRQETDLAIDIRGNLLPSFPSWYQKRVEKLGGDLGIRVEGMLGELKGKAEGDVFIVSEQGDTLRLMPKLFYENQKLRAEVQSDRKFHLDGEIRYPFYENVNWEMEAEGLSVLFGSILDRRFRREIEKVEMSGTFSGSRRGWEVNAKGLSVERGDSPRVFEARFASKKNRKGQGKGYLRSVYFGPGGGELPISAQWTVSKRGVDLHRCDIGDFITINGMYHFRPDEDFVGTFRLSDFSLEKLHSIFPQTRSCQGEIRGKAELTGTRILPNVNFDFDLHGGQFHSVGVFRGHIGGELKNRSFQWFRLSFSKNDTSLIIGNAVRSEGDSLKGWFRGKEIDFGDLVFAITGKRDVLEGIGSVDLQVEGNTAVPLVCGNIEVRNGELGSVGFQELKTEIVDTLSNKTGFLGGTLSIQMGQMVRDDGLTILVRGEIPHGKTRDADVSVMAQGNILGFLPEVSGLFRKAKGMGDVFFRWAGRSGEWVLGSGRMKVESGEVELTSFVKRIKKIRGEAELQEGERFVRISNLSGEIAGGEINITNKWEEKSSKSIVPLTLDRLGVHLGVFQLENKKKGIRIHLPGLMEGGEEGEFEFGGLESGELFTISGPTAFPHFRGTLYLNDNRITYPFLKIGEDAGTDRLIEFLEKVNWELRVVPKRDAHYVRSIESPFGNVYADLKVRDDYGELKIRGMIRGETFRVWGNLVSTEGGVEVLDHFFRPERVTFDYPKGAENPIVSGRLFTTVIDSMGMPSTVWLTVTSMDDDTGLEREGGNWEKVHFRFSTDNPTLGRNEADLLAALGYSAENFKERAYDALGMQVENLVFRPIFRPLERGIRRHLGLDVVRVSSMFSRNLVQLRTIEYSNFDPKFLLRSTKLMLGKYLAPGLFITYSGQVQNEMGLRYHTHGIGFRHAIVMEYTIRPDLFLEMEYTYDSQLLSDRREDKRIWLRHTFPF